MSPSARIFVLYPKVPLVRGGTEIVAETLVNELSNRGYQADIITLPYKWEPKEELLREAMAWRMFNLNCDMVIPLKFPAYFVNHKVKVPWLFHQFRQIYDLFDTPFSGFSNNIPDSELRAKLSQFDRFCLSESKHIYALSQNSKKRLQHFNELEAEVLYSPSSIQSFLEPDGYEPFILAVGRLEDVKRFDLLLEALAKCEDNVSLKIAGTGSREARLKYLANELGVGSRVEFIGQVDSVELSKLYNRCRAVHFAPLDEDYGLITLEAFKAAKPVITATDSGGPTEFVTHEYNGFVLPPEPQAHAGALDKLWRDQELATEYGSNGRKSVENITWNSVLDSLLQWLPQ
jgi:glycosyltransferase involved in cell wall biosynthesis